MASKKLNKKLTKAAAPLPASNEPKELFVCYRCGSGFGKLKGNFAVSHAPVYNGRGHLPYCNKCVDEMFEYYRAKFAEELGASSNSHEVIIAATRRMCMWLDLYWSIPLFTRAENRAQATSFIRNYISLTNEPSYAVRTFDDTLAEEKKSEEIKKQQALITSISLPGGEGDADEEDSATDKVIPVPTELVEFWGIGFPPEVYFELERVYKKYTSNLPDLEPGEQAIYKQICILETTINRDLVSGKAVDKYINTLNALWGSANLKPTQRKDVQAGSVVPFGAEIAKWEEEYPIIDPDPEFEDVDGIKINITAWFLGHLCKMAGIKNTYNEIYEEEMKKYTLERPSYEEDEESESLDNIFDDFSRKIKPNG